MNGRAELDKKISKLENLYDWMLNSLVMRMSYLCSVHVLHAGIICGGFIFHFILKSAGYPVAARIMVLIAVPSMVCFFILFPLWLILTAVLERAINRLKLQRMQIQ